MRQHTAEHRALLGSQRFVTHGRVWVENAEGVFVNLSNVGDVDWFDSAEWNSNLDSPVMAGTVNLAREAEGKSLAPLLTSSTINRKSDNSYAPLLDVGRRVKLDVASLPPYVLPTESSYTNVFQGKIDEVDWSKDTLSIQVRDLGAFILDTYIEVERVYGTEAGVPVESVMQQILDDNLGVGVVTLYVPESPLHYITEYRQDRTTVLEALRTLAFQSGSDVRYKYDAGGNFRVTLFIPDRDKTLVDTTFGPGEYLDVNMLRYSDAEVRNVVIVRFTDKDTDMVDFVKRENLTSIERYGRRFMEIEEGESSNIDTAVEATLMADAAVKDLSFPIAQQEIQTLLFWPAELGDLYTFEANGVHYDSDQTHAVVGIRHSISKGEGFTYITTRGEIAGAYRTWTRKAKKKGTASELSNAPVISSRLLSSDIALETHEVSAVTPNGRPVTLFQANGNDPFPEVSNLTNPGVVTVLRETNEAPDRIVRIKAVSADGLEDYTVINADFDHTPEIALVNTPTPIFEGEIQIGWRIFGAVDDDTRGMLLQVDAGSIQFKESNPTADVHGDAYWFDLTVDKAFTIDLTQDIGEIGDISLTPRELGDFASPGIAGEAYLQRLILEPQTSVVIESPTIYRREATFTVLPVGADLYYRLNGGSWTVVPSVDTHIIEIDTTISEVILEYFSVSTATEGVTEKVKSVNLPHTPLPATYIIANEELANIVAVNVVLPAEAVRWDLYVKRGSTPRNSQGAVDEIYKRANGSQQYNKVNIRLEGNGDSTSTWYFVARAYDSNGNVFEADSSILVTGSNGSNGFLSGFFGKIVEHDGKAWNQITWNFNNAIQNAGVGEYVVKIFERDGPQLTTDRDPRLDPDDTTGTVNFGGYEIEKLTATESTPGAVRRTFRYSVELWHSGVFVVSYPQEVSGYYKGTGDPTGLPTDVPTIATDIVKIAFGMAMKISWVNTNTNLKIRVEWERYVPGTMEWVSYHKSTLDKNKTSHVVSIPDGKNFIRARVAYVNDMGVGTFSPYTLTEEVNR